MSCCCGYCCCRCCVGGGWGCYAEALSSVLYVIGRIMIANLMVGTANESMLFFVVFYGVARAHLPGIFGKATSCTASCMGTARSDTRSVVVCCVEWRPVTQHMHPVRTWWLVCVWNCGDAQHHRNSHNIGVCAPATSTRTPGHSHAVIRSCLVDAMTYVGRRTRDLRRHVRKRPV